MIKGALALLIALAGALDARLPSLSRATLASASPILMSVHTEVRIPNSVTAKSILITDIDTDNAVVERRERERLPIASLTKIMLAHVALKNLDPEQEITISKTAINTIGDEIGLREGEVITLQDLLRAMMISSSNDAAVAVAESIGEHFGASDHGTQIKRTLEEMNGVARALNMNQTSYRDVVGLDIDFVRGIPSNFSSAEDLLRLVRATLSQTPLVWDVSRDSEATIYSLGGRAHHLVHTNSLASQIPHLIGTKTGSTRSSGESLVILYHHPSGHREALILLDAEEGKRIEEAQSLLEQFLDLL
ncbi:MAG: serine hydrolase [Patescibacteria group bacterium]